MMKKLELIIITQTLIQLFPLLRNLSKNKHQKFKSTINLNLLDKKTITNDFEINVFKNFENIKFFNESQIKVETESKFNNKYEFLSNFLLEEQKENNGLLPKIVFEKLGRHKKTNTLQRKFEIHQQQKLKKEIKISEKVKDINIKVKECDELIKNLKNKKLQMSEKKNRTNL